MCNTVSVTEQEIWREGRSHFILIQSKLWDPSKKTNCVHFKYLQPYKLLTIFFSIHKHYFTETR